MPLIDLDTGTGPNTGTGTNAREGADIIKANFAYLEALILASKKVKLGDFWLDKGMNIDVANFEVGDKFDGWLESNTRYVAGIVIALPFDVDDDTKTKLAVNNYI